MARIKSKTLKWKPPADADVVKYRIYVTYGDSAEPYTGTMVEVTETHAVLPDIFPEGTFSQEGNYIIQVTAVDDQGNESDERAIVYPFDFFPPPPVSGLVVE